MYSKADGPCGLEMFLNEVATALYVPVETSTEAKQTTHTTSVQLCGGGCVWVGGCMIYYINIYTIISIFIQLTN